MEAGIMNMSQLEEQGGEEGGAEVVDLESRSLEFLRRKMFLHHAQKDLPFLDSSRHISISSGTRQETPTSSSEIKTPTWDAIRKYFQSPVKLSLSDSEGEEVGVEVESESQIPLSHHYHSMDEQSSLYRNLPGSYFLKYRYLNVPKETPPSSPNFPKLLDHGRHNNTALLSQWDNHISSSHLLIQRMLDTSREVHPLYEGVRKSMWRPGEWQARGMGRNGRSRLSLGTFDTPDDAARAHDRGAFRIWGKGRLNFCEIRAPGHPIPAAYVSGCSASPEGIIKDDHFTIQIHQLEEDQETIPTPTHVVQGLRAKTKTFGKKAVNTINRSTQAIPNELLVGLIGLTYQFMSMPWTDRNTRYILTVANALGFSFLLTGMVRRARKCRCANLLLFMGTLFSSGGILFSMARDVHGILGWFVPMACLLVVMTAVVF